jgi:hypothetical protein
MSKKNSKVKMKPSKKRSGPYPYGKFVAAWAASASINEVAKKTGLSRSSVSQIATRLRKNKVKLPPMRTSRRQPIDAAALNKLLK